ncbi:tetratricopeptide repeat protein [Parafilimonas sp.]|uniref:tetratricopeptide repeat protein n=1 Tax=Parafilimonas sp. TaxID=1969739 RepID=UPI0039E422FA
MKKTILSLVTFLSAYAIVSAQSIDDGKKFLYYERLTSAKQVFQKLAAGNKDAQAVYWLGQAYLDAEQLDSAKIVYQNALNAGLNDPWIWIGSAHVDVLQGGDINAAKQKFEQAITATTKTKGKNKGPDPDILDAIGRAMADGGSGVGDPNYGIDKLKQAAAIAPQNPDIFNNLGVCYLKLGGDHGGEAFEAFNKSTTASQQYARGFYRIGRIYQSQRNLESMNEWYGKAIAADPAFAPVYLQYFEFYSETDVSAAKEYLDKYIANADKDCKTEYFVGNYLLRAGKYQESLQKAKDMENGGCANYTRLNVLYAYNYDRLGDSVQARTYIQKYFATAPAETIQPDDYAFAGTVLAKFPETGDSAIAYLQKAAAIDTIKEEQIKFLTTAGEIAAKNSKFSQQLSIVKQMEALKGGKLSETEYFTLAKAITDAKAADATHTFDSSKYLVGDSVIQLYITAYPDKPQGYSFRTRFAKMTDADTTRGLAVAPIEQYNDFLSKDTGADNKKTAYFNYYYLLIYYAQYASDIPKDQEYQKAIDVTEKMKALYPDPNSEEYKNADGAGKQLQAALDKFNKSKNSGSGSGKSQK